MGKCKWKQAGNKTQLSCFLFLFCFSFFRLQSSTHIRRKTSIRNLYVPPIQPQLRATPVKPSSLDFTGTQNPKLFGS
jgi:hypothetical protein